MSDINERILRNRITNLTEKRRLLGKLSRAEEAELNTLSAEQEAADTLRLTDTRAEYNAGRDDQPDKPQTITINRAFSDGSTLSLTITGDEARHFYYRYLFPLLRREAD